MRILALDLGSKSCGFAICDKDQIIVSGIENFMFQDYHFIRVIERVKYFLYESEYKNEIETIVLGLPLNMDGSESKTTHMIRKFHERLSKEIGIPIILQDERQTTMGARSILKEAGLSKTKQKSIKDSLAAQLILEDYLRRTKN